MKAYLVVLLLVIGILGGFYGGYKVGHNNTVSSSKQNQAPRTTFGGFGGARGPGAPCPSPGAPSPSSGTNAIARGTVSNLASNSLTVTNSSCDERVVFGNTVQVQKTVAGSTSDLADNISITVVGTRQADGSIKATVIQIGGGG